MRICRCNFHDANGNFEAPNEHSEVIFLAFDYPRNPPNKIYRFQDSTEVTEIFVNYSNYSYRISSQVTWVTGGLSLMIFPNSVGWAKNHVEPLPIFLLHQTARYQPLLWGNKAMWVAEEWLIETLIKTSQHSAILKVSGNLVFPNLAFIYSWAWYLHVFATRIYSTFWNEYVGYLLQPPSSSHFFNHLWEATESGRLASRHFLPILVLGKLESRDLGTWLLTLNDEWLTTACHFQHILLLVFFSVCLLGSCGWHVVK